MTAKQFEQTRRISQTRSIHLNVITQHFAMALGTTLSETFSSCVYAAQTTVSLSRLSSKPKLWDLKQSRQDWNTTAQAHKRNNDKPFPRPDIVSLKLVADSRSRSTTSKIKKFAECVWKVRNPFFQPYLCWYITENYKCNVDRCTTSRRFEWYHW